MSEGINSLYQHPEADLTLAKNEEKPILRFKRFSAWGVLFLAIITFGIYPLYWINTRVKLANTLTKHIPIVSLSLVIIFTLFTVINIIIQLRIFLEIILSVDSMYISAPGNIGTIFVLLAGVLISAMFNLINLILFFIIIYQLRKAFTEIINQGSDEFVIIDSIKTFFFTIIYLQYKINEAIDTQSN